MTKFTDPQPAPTPFPRPSAEPVWDLVVVDMRARKEMGEQKYKTFLHAFNGRDPLIDAYQEALDLAVYLRQALFEKYGE